LRPLTRDYFREVTQTYVHRPIIHTRPIVSLRGLQRHVARIKTKFIINPYRFHKQTGVGTLSAVATTCHKVFDDRRMAGHSTEYRHWYSTSVTSASSIQWTF